MIKNKQKKNKLNLIDIFETGVNNKKKVNTLSYSR